MKTGTLVINAHITNKPGLQMIEISKSVTLIHPSADPVSGGFAEVIREDGKFREFEEDRPGFYGCFFDEDFFLRDFLSIFPVLRGVSSHF